MSLKHAVLGLVLERRGYGYDLVQRLTDRLGPAWQLTPSAVYFALDQLSDAGAVVPDRQHVAAADPVEPDFHCRRLGGEAHGVAQDVLDRAAQELRVALEECGALRCPLDAFVDGAGFEPGILHDVVQQRGQVDTFAVQGGFAAGELREMQDLADECIEPLGLEFDPSELGSGAAAAE